MLPPDPIIAYGQAKAMIAKRHADAARQNLVAVSRNEAGQSAGDQRGVMAHRLAVVVRRLRVAVATRAHASPSTEQPGTIVG
jgi:hypothetical protein